MSQQAQKLQQQLIDNLHTSVLLFDDELTLVYANPAAEVLFAMSLRHMLGKSVFELVQCEKGDSRNQLREVIESGNSYTEREITIRTPHHPLTVDCTVMTISEFGQDTLMMELQQVDRQLRISHEEQLISQQQASQELLRGLAHEIKNPLGGLRGAAQLLEMELGDAELKEYTGVIISEADRLRNLVDRMLGPSKLPNFAELNIHEVLERVRQLVRAESGEQLTIVRDYDPSIPLLKGDSDQLIQALLNIVRNGARALNNRGEMTLRTRVLRQFTLGNQRHRLVAKIEISDNGPGIPHAIRETLFLPMITASDDGMGLGLSIAQSLIARLHGLIECDSKPGKTTFTIYLPMDNESD
ncbi:MAG TPA: nitrogen regulation protein NR(II) [Gammaproteobacteria bacterium]|nr:nitrogen regulation protein NR(II) [Gammaproteobacteria bacterium]